MANSTSRASANSSTTDYHDFRLPFQASLFESPSPCMVSGAEMTHSQSHRYALIRPRQGTSRCVVALPQTPIQTNERKRNIPIRPSPGCRAGVSPDHFRVRRPAPTSPEPASTWPTRLSGTRHSDPPPAPFPTFQTRHLTGNLAPAALPAVRRHAPGPVASNLFRPGMKPAHVRRVGTSRPFYPYSSSLALFLARYSVCPALQHGPVSTRP